MVITRIIKVIGIISIILVYPMSVMASWSGPNEIVKGNWGNSIIEFGYQFGDTRDQFPWNFVVLSDKKIIIDDWVNGRIKLYSSLGKHMKSIAQLGFPMFEQNPDRIISFKWNAQEKVNNIGIYNLKSEIWEWVDTKNYFKYINKIDLIVTNENIFLADGKNGYHYTTAGQLLKSYNARPLELGVVNEVDKGSGKYESTVEFPDYKYKVNSTVPKYTRDIFGNLFVNQYYAKRFEGEDSDVICYRVIRVDRCTGEEYIFEPPRSKYEPLTAEEKKAPTSQPKLGIEYGEPVVSPLGDLYCWARTKTEYKILKWTWQGPEDAPQSLKISSGVAGLKLNWAKPVKDAETVTGYQILRSAEVCGSFSEVVTVKKDKLSFEDTTIKPPWKYYYVVKAVRDKKYSGESNKVYMQWK